MGTFIFPKEIVADKGYKVILLRVKKKSKWSEIIHLPWQTLHYTSVAVSCNQGNRCVWVDKYVSF